VIDRLRPGLLAGLVLLAGCATMPPEHTSNLCSVFQQNKSWYRDARRAQQRHGTPIHVTMAIMEKESAFNAHARTRRTYFLGLIPTGHVTTAYGYAQAKDETWAWYQQQTGHHGASRSDFGDAVDFIAWYVAVAHRELGLSKWDAYSQYLAYHEGLGGYRRRTYRKQPGLESRAAAVKSLSLQYARQLRSCAAELERGGWWPFW
jgi:hypothetical protein